MRMTVLPRRAILACLASASLLAQAGAEEESPNWFALGAPFRVADSGTVINGDTEKKLPIYDKVIPEVYQFADRDKVQKSLLSVVAHPRWFTRVGPAKLSKDMPLVDQGASLSFGILPLPEGRLQFDLALEAKERDVFFQAEHRRNDITPFLFSYTGDGVAMDAEPDRGAIMGGVRSVHVLLKKGERSSWSFKVDPKNVLASFKGKDIAELSVVAAFSELRQEYGTGGAGGIIEGVGDVPEIDDDWDAPKSYGPEGEEIKWEHRPILIRSEPVVLSYVEGKWSVKGQGGK